VPLPLAHQRPFAMLETKLMQFPPGVGADADPRRASRGGFTLIEVLVTASVLLIGLLAMTSTSVVVNSLRKSSADRSIAQAAIQAIVEDLHASAREAGTEPVNWANDILAVYGPGGIPGDTFPVEGLEPWPGEANVATVALITDETTTDAGLQVAAGMPRDLDGDGAASNTDVSATASLLPAIVRLRWRGDAGQQEITQVVYLLRY
jgi:prepilin-type N-terminal cleavage/methylation domain-containing protein